MSTPTITRPGAKPARRRKSPLGSRWTPILFLLPGVLYLLLFQGYPLLQQLRLSFTETYLLTLHESKWVGLANYVELIASPSFQQTITTTAIYVLACVIGAISVGLATALLLNAPFRGRGIARALIAVPWAAPSVAVAMIAIWMMNAQYGIVNRFFDAIGMGIPDGAILDSTERALPAILATTIWQLFPFCSVVLLAALQGVSQEQKEAAMMDGAGRWWIFRVVTWPVIRPTVALLGLLLTIWSIRRFELIWIMTKGGPLGTTRTLVIDLYSTAFDKRELGMAAAIGIVGVLISLVVVIAHQWLEVHSERKAAR